MSFSSRKDYVRKPIVEASVDLFDRFSPVSIVIALLQVLDNIWTQAGELCQSSRVVEAFREYYRFSCNPELASSSSKCSTKLRIVGYVAGRIGPVVSVIGLVCCRHDQISEERRENRDNVVFFFQSYRSINFEEGTSFSLVNPCVRTTAVFP